MESEINYNYNYKINIHTYSCNIPVILQILIKLEFSQQSFNKYPNIKFQENPSSGYPVVPRRQRDRQTDRHDKSNSHFPQFCECA